MAEVALDQSWSDKPPRQTWIQFRSGRSVSICAYSFPPSNRTCTTHFLVFLSQISLNLIKFIKEKHSNIFSTKQTYYENVLYLFDVRFNKINMIL
ncbi:hypothetical protein DAI22_08g000200 [Oryza sativa Japonica Group]|nr:hypothetical protein DAI22_08g000200 [Oryza sativa Japonica Group]